MENKDGRSLKTYIPLRLHTEIARVRSNPKNERGTYRGEDDGGDDTAGEVVEAKRNAATGIER